MIALLDTLKWSAAVGGVVLLSLLCRPLLEKRYRAKWRYWLWLILAAFLLLTPVPWTALLPGAALVSPAWVVEISAVGGEGTLKNDGTAMPSAGTQGDLQGNWVGAGHGLSDAGEDPQNHVIHTEPYGADMDDKAVDLPAAGDRHVFFPIGEARALQALRFVLPVLWLAGAVCFLLWRLCGSLVFFRRVRACTEAGEAVQALYGEICEELGIARAPALSICPQVQSPMLVGLLRPRLLLPGEDCGAPELAFVLKHELTHYRRRDLWYKLFLMMANALHWFNPLVYLMVREADRDLELTCDDAVVANEPMEVRRAYSETLLANLGRQQKKSSAHSVFSTYFDGGTGTMKARFRNILGDGRRGHGLPVLVLALLITMAAGCGVRVEEQGAPDFGGQGEGSQGYEDMGKGEGSGETVSIISSDKNDSQGGVDGAGGNAILTRGHDEDGKLRLWVCPTGKLLEVGGGGWYYTPEDQAVWLDALEQARARIVREGETVPGGKERGIKIEYQGLGLFLMENGDIITHVTEDNDGYWGRIAADDCTALRGLCEEAAREIGLSEPVGPEQIRGIKKASLHWGNQDFVLADSESLAKLESWLSDSEYLPLGAGCCFTAGLTLELEGGNVTLAMATDGCRTWTSNGVCYDYGGSAYRNGGGGSDSRKFFDLFGIVYTDVDTLPAYVSFLAQYIRTDGYVEGEQYPKTFWITSTEELNDYYDANRERYDLGSRENPMSDQTIGFVDAIRRYDDDFFRERDLIMVVLEEGSGSIRHEVSSILFTPADSEGGKVSLQPVIVRRVPEVGTDDMAEWHIMIEVNKKYGAQNSELLAAKLE